MSNGESSPWLKKVLILALVGGAAAWGFMKGVPADVSSVVEEEKQPKKLTVKNFGAAIEAEDVLVVVNLTSDQCEESKSLEEFFAELEKRDIYSDQVLFAEVDGNAEPELARQMGADPRSPRPFVGFYAGGVKLGDLVNQTDRTIIQSEIERHLKGLIKRTGPGWLPEVEGMSRISNKP